ncbi:MAG TPA: hypothetical protein VM327_05030 [Candidatus Thermoplasmatota archaeon]|nr:hypothetical protein [Candidatus Thermoplasmatota archaeon]
MQESWPSKVLVTVLLAAMLGGCADQPEFEGSEVQGPAAPAMEPRMFDVDVFVRSRPGCTVAVCAGGGVPAVIYASPDDASIRAVAFDIAKVDGEDRPVEWKLTCVAADDEDPGCLRPLAHGQEPLPVHVESHGLNLTPATELLLELVIPPIVTPVVDNLATIAFGSTAVRGTVDLALLGNASGIPPSVLETIAVSFEGHSGPCFFVAVEPNCTHWPGGTRFIVDGFEGTAVAANLTMTWTSTSPADEVLELWVGPYSCSTTCPPAVRTAGTSPLVVDLRDLQFRDDVDLSVYHADPTGADPTGFGAAYIGTRTPLQVEGSVTVELTPGAAPGRGTSATS